MIFGYINSRGVNLQIRRMRQSIPCWYLPTPVGRTAISHRKVSGRQCTYRSAVGVMAPGLFSLISGRIRRAANTAWRSIVITIRVGAESYAAERPASLRGADRKASLAFPDSGQQCLAAAASQ